MGIKAKFTKGGLVLSDAYLMISGFRMIRYNRPVAVLDKDGIDTGVTQLVPAVQYTAQVQIYPSHQMRIDDFGNTDFNSAFTFQHVDGLDAVAEAYARIKTSGLENWVINDIEDLL